MSEVEQRQNKVICALFLILGKAVAKLTAKERMELSTTETEIREAWDNQRSPVRLVSELRNNFPQNIDDVEFRPTERIFNVVMADLDLRKTGINLPKGKMPEGIVTHGPAEKKVRVFDLE